MLRKLRFGLNAKDVLAAIRLNWYFGWTWKFKETWSMGKWIHFSDAEVMGLQTSTVAMLDQARGLAGVPFVITSGLRNLSENARAGGVGDSSHLRGLAVDLACVDSHDRLLMVRALLQVGFVRIGVYDDGHIHVDNDTSLPQEVLWLKAD